MAQLSARSVRTLRTAALALPSPVPMSCHCSSQQNQHRLFSSRIASTPRNLAAQRTRPNPHIPPRRPFFCQQTRLRLQNNTAQGRRNFHFVALVNATVDAAEASILQLHAATHTPWYITIPLVALGVNLVVRLPFSAHSRKLSVKRARLGPLLQAWTSIHSREALKEQKIKMQEQRRTGGDTVSPALASAQAEVLKRFRKTSNRVYAAFGLQQWKLYGTFLALPPWLVIIEAIRRISGAPTGLLGMILRRGSTVDATSAAAAEATTAATAASASSGAVDVASIASAASPSTTTGSLSTLADPTFTTGGCLWFPDLTVADPYHILPVALSAMLIVNVLPSTDAGRRQLFGLSAGERSAPGAGNRSSISLQSAVARGLHRSLLLMAVAVGPLTLYFPAAIHLYWFSSATVAFFMTRTIRLLWPAPETIARSSGQETLPWITPPVPQKDAKKE